MVIYGPTHTKFDEDLGVILVNDCNILPLEIFLVNLLTRAGFHTEYFKLVQYGTSTSSNFTCNNTNADTRNEYQCHATNTVFG